VNVFRQEHGSGAVLRMIPPRVLAIEELGLPALVANVARITRGLVLVTGPTGSGKSTTLAALLDWINRTRSAHIITIEDPVEFIHRPAKSVISHRELGFDTPTFSGALKAALREDPDVVLVGELRDLETMSMALQAAETGLLVFGTLHTNSAAKAVDRLIDSFPAEEQEQVRTVLAEVLKGVVAQVLLRKKGGGRAAAFEVLRGSSALSNNIREGKTAMINTLIQTGRNAGMIGMDQSLADLVVAGTVESEEAFEKALDKDQFRGLLDKRTKAAAKPAPAAPPAG
jgi:twitching motility protein PilT